MNFAKKHWVALTVGGIAVYLAYEAYQTAKAVENSVTGAAAGAAAGVASGVAAGAGSILMDPFNIITALIP